MDHITPSSGSRDLRTTSTLGPLTRSPCADTDEDKRSISAFTKSSSLSIESGRRGTSRSIESASSTSQRLRTPPTLQTTRSSRSSRTSAADLPFTALSKGHSDDGRERSRPLSTGVSRRASRFGNLNNVIHASEQLSRLTQSGQQRSLSASPPSKRRRSNHYIAGGLQSPFTPYIAAPNNLNPRRSLSAVHSQPHYSLDPIESQKYDTVEVLRLDFNVQGRDIWGNMEIQDYTLEFDVDRTRECLGFYAEHLRNSHIDGLNSAHHDQEIRTQTFSDPPEAYLRPAFAALCGLTSELNIRNQQLRTDIEVLEDKIDLLEAGPKTPESFEHDDENDMVQRLLTTIQELKTEIALLKLTQHDLPFSPQDGYDQSRNAKVLHDKYLQLLPAPEPIQRNETRMSVVVNECREEERAKYEQRLKHVRQGISKRQEKLDALTLKHEQDLSELQAQLSSQQDERKSMLEHIHYLQESHDDYSQTLKEVDRQHKQLQQKYDALDLEYVKVKKQRDGAMDAGRHVNDALRGLLLRQVESQVKLQRNFEQTKIRNIKQSSATHDRSISPSPSSADTMENLRQRNNPQRTRSLASSSVDKRIPGKKPRPAPIRPGRPSARLPQIERSESAVSEPLEAIGVTDPREIAEDIPPGSPGAHVWESVMEGSKDFGPPGFTPLFETEAFRQWQWQIGQKARILFDVTSMDAKRRLYTFRKDEIVYVFSGPGHFWPVQALTSDDDQVFVVPKNAFELICEHGYAYRDTYCVEKAWSHNMSGDHGFIALSEEDHVEEESIVYCAHMRVFYLSGNFEKHGCLLLRDGNRGFAPLSCLRQLYHSNTARDAASCPCSDSQPYTRFGVILKEVVGEPEGIRFQQDDAVDIAHHTSTGEFCVRLKKTGATGFVHAANLQIHQDMPDVIWDSRLSRTGSQMRIDNDIEGTFPSPKDVVDIWNLNLLNNNPQYHRRSKLEGEQDKRYRDWVQGPPLGNHFVETADFRKLPRPWQDILTINPPNVRKGANRARAKSLIHREHINKYQLKRDLNIGLQSKVTIADGEVTYSLLDGTEEDRGYMSEPVTREKRSQRLHYIHEPGKPLVDVDKFKPDDDESVAEILRTEEEGVFLYQNHRRRGFLTEEGLRALDLYINERAVRNAIEQLHKWRKTGSAVAYKLRPNNTHKDKPRFEDTDLFTIEQVVLLENVSGVLAVHRDKYGERKDPTDIFIKIDEISCEEPSIPTKLVAESDDESDVARIVLLGTEKERVDLWKCVKLGDGTPAHRNLVRKMKFMGTPFPADYVPLVDVIHIIEDAEKRSKDKEHHLDDRVPELNETVRKLYDLYSDMTAAENKSDTDKVNSKDEPDQLATRMNQPEQEDRVLSTENLGLQEENARLKHQLAEFVQLRSSLEREKALLKDAEERHEKMIKELEAEKQAMLDKQEKQRIENGVLPEVPYRMRVMGELVLTYFRHDTTPEKMLQLSELIRAWAAMMVPDPAT